MTDEQIATLDGYITHLDIAAGDPIHVMQDEMDALRAALALASQTCGNCGHWGKAPRARTASCRLKILTSRNATDGCRLCWVPKP